MRCDVAIVGAGIVGAACTLELASAGLQVVVIERDTIGSGATAAGMGHIVVMDDCEAQLLLSHYSQQLWEDLAGEAPEQHEYTRCGTIWIASDEEEMQVVRVKERVYRAHCIACQMLDAKGLYELEPHLRQGLQGGLLVPGDAVVYPPRSAALLMEHALHAGASLEREAVAQLVPGGLRLGNGTTIYCEHVVLANGARAVDLAPELPVRPKKGHLVITDRYPGFVHHQLVELGYIKRAHEASVDTVAFNVQPRCTGQLLIGSSRQYAATSDLDYTILAQMLSLAIDYLPMLGGLSVVRIWTGFRAATPDGLPLIGPHPERRGVWLATGHEGLGITTSLGTAKLLAAQIFGRAPAIPLEPYLPARLW